MTPRLPRRRASENRLLVLGWHNVVGTYCFPSGPGRGVAGLTRQLQLLARTAHVLPLGHALDSLARGDRLPPRSCAITFDDGYADNAALAAPVLRRLGLPATFFLVPGLLSRTAPCWWEMLGWAFARGQAEHLVWEEQTLSLQTPGQRRGAYGQVSERLKRRPGTQREQDVNQLINRLSPQEGAPPGDLFLDWDGARWLARCGFDIGSHTMTHPILTEETPEVVRQELVDSRRELQQELDVPVRLLAYPNGTDRDFDETATTTARAAGYDFAVTTVDGLNGSALRPYEVRRSVVYPERGAADILLSLVAAGRASRSAPPSGGPGQPGT